MHTRVLTRSSHPPALPRLKADADRQIARLTDSLATTSDSLQRTQVRQAQGASSAWCGGGGRGARAARVVPLVAVAEGFNGILARACCFFIHTNTRTVHHALS